MLGFNGGRLGALNAPSLTSARGIWTPNEQYIARTAGNWPLATDPYFANVSLLLHCNAPNGSTVFTDSSSNAFVPSRGGAAVISTSQSVFGGSSLSLPGNKSFLSYADNAVFQMGTGDFTVETWYYISSITTTMMLVAPVNIGSPYNVLSMELNPGSVGWRVMRAGFGAIVTANVASPLNTWTHVAATRSSGVVRFFMGGTQYGGSITNTTSMSMSLGGMQIGVQASNFSSFNGFIDEFRITKGVARYTAAFSVPTSPFPDF